MVNVVGIRFRNAGKIYYFDPGELSPKSGDKAIVETARGIECGDVVVEKKQVDESNIIAPLKNVIRVADEEDIKHEMDNREKEKEAYNICLEKIKKHELKMKLIDVEYTFDNNKVLFYFTADGRVDFRELVKDLASVFKTRIELRQIGVRDESKMMGGLGMCGRPLCCNTHLTEFQPVSIKMAKEQGLSLNPTKISGTCGRLMCCLKYEQCAYEHALKIMPRVGAIVSTPNGQGTVVGVNLLRETLKIRLDKDNETTLNDYLLNEIKVIKDSEKELEAETEEINLDDLKALED